jgi:hypothetical protein
MEPRVEKVRSITQYCYFFDYLNIVLQLFFNLRIVNLNESKSYDVAGFGVFLPAFVDTTKTIARSSRKLKVIYFWQKMYKQLHFVLPR